MKKLGKIVLNAVNTFFRNPNHYPLIWLTKFVFIIFGIVLLFIFIILPTILKDKKDNNLKHFISDAQIVNANAKIMSNDPHGTVFPHSLRAITVPDSLPGTGLIRFFARITSMHGEYIEIYAPASSKVRIGSEIQVISYRQRRSFAGGGYRFMYFLYTPPAKTFPPL